MKRLESYFQLKDRVIVITGGAGFLGIKHAEAVLDAGGIPVLLEVNDARIVKAIEHLKSYAANRPVLGFSVDITDKPKLEQISSQLIKKFGTVHGLINNAANNPAVSKQEGLKSSSRFETMTLDEWNADVSVGLTGAFLCSQVFGQEMAKKRRGVIVNISSDLGIISPDQRLYRQEGVSEEEQDVKPVTYSVVKTGILGLTRYLATYWADQNVRINSVVLGGVERDQPKEFRTRVSTRIPMGRLAMSEEYKASIIYLLSEASSYMTGSTVVIDGGRTIW